MWIVRGKCPPLDALSLSQHSSSSYDGGSSEHDCGFSNAVGRAKEHFLPMVKMKMPMNEDLRLVHHNNWDINRWD